MKKKLTRCLSLALSLLLSAALLTGCQKGADSGTSAPPDEPLIVYTNSGTDGLSDWLSEEAKAAGLNVTIVDVSGASNLSNRIIAEKNNQIADVVFGLNAIEYEKIKASGVEFAAYEPSWAGEADPNLIDKDGFYYPICVQPLVWIYNTDLYTAETAPKDMLELAEKYSGKYSLLPTTGGTSRSFLASLLVRFIDEDGELCISDEGWEAMRAFIQNAHIIGDEDYYGDLIAGKYGIMSMWGSGYFSKAVDYEAENTFYMAPESGVPMVTEMTAIFAGTDKMEAAKAFVEWFGGAEMQAARSEKFGTVPASSVALEQASDEVREMMTLLHAQDIDWSYVAEYLDAWVEKIELEFIQ